MTQDIQVSPQRALAQVQPSMPMAELMRICEALVRSRYFKDLTDASQALVKIMVGMELGIAPMAAVAGIYIVEGRPQLSATMMAALIQRSERFSYQVETWTDEICTIAYSEIWNGTERSLGKSSFSAADARKAKLLDAGKDNWQKYTRSMLYARAMAMGARAYCPSVFAGMPVYDTSEITESDTVGASADEMLNGGDWLPPAAITDEQKKILLAEFAKQGWNGPRRAKWLKEEFGVSALSGLAEEEAAIAIAQLQGTESDIEVEATEIQEPTA